jgi:hypothetical protein
VVPFPDVSIFSGRLLGICHLGRIRVLRLPPIETFSRIVGGLNYLFIQIRFPMGTVCSKIIGFGLPTTYRGT